MAEVELRDATAVTVWSAVTVAALLTTDSYWYRKDGVGPKYVRVALTYDSAPSAIQVDIEHSMGGVIWRPFVSSTDTAGENISFFAPQGFFRLKVKSHTASGSETVTATVTLTNSVVAWDTAGDLGFGDDEELQFGDAANGDASIKWNAVDLEVLPKVNDTGKFSVGDGTTDMDFKVFLDSAADFVTANVGNVAFEFIGAARADFQTTGSSNIDGNFLRAGVTGTKLIGDTASTVFDCRFLDAGATSGTAQGLAQNLFLTGAAGSGDGLDIFTEASDVALTNMVGIRSELNFLATGSVTGEGFGIESIVHINNSGGADGDLACFNADIDSDGATSDPTGSDALSFYRFEISGDTTGDDDVNTDAVAFNFQGATLGSGSMLYESAGAVPGNSEGSIKFKVGSNLRYLLYFNAEAA